MNRLSTSTGSLKQVRPCRPVQQNKRQGDWVCLLCNNLNYSFRESCNRCRGLTRQENQKLSCKNNDVRQPLGQLYFHRIQSLQEMPCTASIHRDNHSEGEPTQTAEAETWQTWKTLDQKKAGFASLLYLTPTRYGKDNCEEDLQARGYKSPKVLPSVSPLLRSLKI